MDQLCFYISTWVNSPVFIGAWTLPALPKSSGVFVELIFVNIINIDLLSFGKI